MNKTNNWDFFGRIHAMERPVKPEQNSATVVDAANYAIWGMFLNLHSGLLREHLSYGIFGVLNMLHVMKLSPEDAHAIALKWKDLPEMMGSFSSLAEEILRDLANR